MRRHGREWPDQLQDLVVTGDGYVVDVVLVTVTVAVWVTGTLLCTSLGDEAIVVGDQVTVVFVVVVV